ncbi:hypothetical protein Mgra_00002190 [Meloidogyne graminicola]|uniref:G-protein coupled receptors family 1 profile domain-containing protein n=1 Tax=Meloidogyne graminicola TaxID=189291 RepID=A0A8S9ZY88_9BILA|nr:hypothetical protein Mgra_00002190 [Meloidogyne graminicola]
MTINDQSCSNIIYQFRQIYVCIYKYFPFSQYYWSYFFVQPSAIVLLNAAYFHIIMLAINRFHAVFFPFNYQKCWEKKNIKYFILIIWLINFIWSTLQYIITIYFDNNEFIYKIIVNGLFVYDDLEILITICISIPLYTALKNP